LDSALIFEVSTTLSAWKVSYLHYFIISSLLCQIPSETTDVFQPLKMIEGLAHGLHTHKMRSSHEHFLWFREVQLTFLAQSSPFLPPPSCFVAALVFPGSSWDQKQKSGVL